MDNRKLKLYFKDASQNQKSISVDYPKTDYTPDELRSAMDRMLASRAWDYNKKSTRNSLG